MLHLEKINLTFSKHFVVKNKGKKLMIKTNYNQQLKIQLQKQQITKNAHQKFMYK